MNRHRIRVDLTREEPDALRIADTLRDAARGEAEAKDAAAGDAEMVLCLDEASLRTAREGSAPFVAAVCPFFAVEWSDGLDEADLVLVAHEALVDDAVAAGAPRARVRAVGPLVPRGFEPAADRAALRAELSLPAEGAVVLVDATAVAGDPAVSLVQLSLTGEGIRWLFDVGADPELARTLRRSVPGYGLDAWMFAEGEQAARAWQLADVVLTRLGAPAMSRALALGAPIALVPPARHRLRTAHAVETAKLARIADALATLAVTVEAALAEPALEASRAILAALDPRGAAKRAIDAVVEAATEDGRPSLPAGLPVGLERIGERGAVIEGARREPSPEPSSAPRSDALDRAVDAELAALREKLGIP